ncbi:MAG: thioredoxin domain-containing protein, partial [Gemmataceae bacterium]|nr:thioredoxin domain-containing protein [Gemmataceae bacterium]
MRTLSVLLAVLALAAGPPPRRKPNALARESSPYLLQHARNPVDWMPWGPTAFAKARKEKKLVFLSIGYSSCHWCHVMEKESFSHHEVAELMNRLFVCIKVDREERPDIDQVYMTALNVQGQSGGWPLSMFLDAEGRPIVGGTYWPREDKTLEGEKVRGFKSILQGIAKLHKDEPKEIEAAAEKLANATSRALLGTTRGLALVDLDRKLVEGATEELRERFDPRHGGFGNPRLEYRGPKFPMPSNLLFLLGEARRGDKEAGKMASLTLDRLARGGIRDHLGGGFHRYSVERSWTVPHFEKMLYDNAQLLEAYARAHALEKKPEHERVLRTTAEFVAREMTSPEGAFYSALDADSEDEEGRFYVWTPKEFLAALPDKAERELFGKAYGTSGGVNFEGKYHILKLPEPLGEAAEAKLAPLRKKLFDLRARRERPFLDTKVLTAWNGQMIAGLARAGSVLEDKAMVARAEKAARFVLANLKTKEGRLLRSWAAVPGEKPKARLNGCLDDYAYLVHGLLALHEATGAKEWLDEAAALTGTMARFHGDEKGGGFWYTSSDHEKLFARGKDGYDGAQPSAGSAAAGNLVRLWIATKDEKHAKLAEKAFRSMGATLKSHPSSLCWAADALA